MNTVNIDTREKVNERFLEDMHREAKERQVLRLANQEKDWEKKRGRQRQNVFLMIKAFFAWLAAHLHHVPHKPAVHPVRR